MHMYYEKERYEENIDILSLLAEMIRKWKWLVAAVLAGALLLGIYKSGIRWEKVGSEDAIAKLQDEMDANNRMIDSSNNTIASNQANIERDNERIVDKEKLLQSIRQTKAEMEENMEGSHDEVILRLQVLADDPTATIEQREFALDQISAIRSQAMDVCGQLYQISALIISTEDEIANLQKEIDGFNISTRNCTATIDDMREQLAQQQKEMDRLTDNRGRRAMIPYIIFGGFLGGVAFCGVIFVRYITSKKLRSSQQLRDQFDLPVLGEFRSAAAEKHGKFGRMLDKLSKDVPTLPDDGKIYELIGAGVRAAGLPERLAITGTAGKDTLEKVRENLGGCLSPDCELTVVDAPAYSADFLADIQKYTVLLVEAKGVSDRREIAKLMEIFRRNGTNVVGAVVM